MKAKLMRTAGVLLAGTIMFTVAYTNPTYGNAQELTDGNVRAGVASEFSVELSSYTGMNERVASGVTGTVSNYLANSITVAQAEAQAQVAETDTVMTATGQIDTFGYTN